MSLDYVRSLRSKVGSQLIFLPSVAAVISDSEGRLLLQQKASGEGWSLPAGAIELGETPEQAIAREVLEETGLQVVTTEVLAVFGGSEFRYIYPNGDQVEYLVVLFKCVTTGDPGGFTDTETVRLKYTAFNEMPKLALPYPAEFLFPDITPAD
ncbi:NUDIX domain-containing protein [Rhizobium leguminosarum]|uniref:NUDIX domain-containing protein n=1 Tax=Rhizobium leguminosarum TaxID=384 RepID=UPI00027D913E|nr:NUDIX domain-containing protein [Rhizobium leguminosarum]RWY89832.1 NUDIX domain-containing protein [Rhizobium leguminosarum]